MLKINKGKMVFTKGNVTFLEILLKLRFAITITIINSNVIPAELLYREPGHFLMLQFSPRWNLFQLQ